MNNLFIVATPIGNMGDISKRAISVLQNTNQIICEDTRVTKKLLDKLKIEYGKKQFLAFFSGQEKQRFVEAMSMIESGDTVLVSDTGTPTINDPGHILVKFIQENRKENIKIQVIPGANASIVALVYSGLPTDRFSYLGFLPEKLVDQTKLFKQLVDINRIIPQTFIAYESVHRIKQSLESINNFFGDSISISICRELTKLYEQVEIGTPTKILEMINNKTIELKGEFVVVMRIKKAPTESRSL